jgi:hypothetical protein
MSLIPAGWGSDGTTGKSSDFLFLVCVLMFVVSLGWISFERLLNG